MVTVSRRLIHRHLEEPGVGRMFRLLEEDPEVRTYLAMSNRMVVDRMNYNDHGPVHSRISAGSALEILELLGREVEPTTVREGICDYEGAKLVALCGSYLHDLGNAVHRGDHHLHGCILAAPILERLYHEIYPGDPELVYRLKTETLHAIYAHDEGITCLTVEAGAGKVADGTDMAEGRARIPYRSGAPDIHAVSAMAIRRVDLERGEEAPLEIRVHMDNPAGVFQIEEVLGRKIATSGIMDLVKVIPLLDGRAMRTGEA